MTEDTCNTYKDKDTTELILLAKKGDTHARSMLVENNIGLVWSIVRRLQKRGH